jgi:hypothetical protein
MKGLTPEELKLLIRSVGTHRADRALSPMEVSELLKKATEAGATRKECATALGVGSTQISTFLRLLDIAPKIRHLADWGNTSASGIAFSSLAELSRLTHDQQISAATAMIEHHLSWKEAVQLVQIAQRSNRPIDESIGSVVGLRPTIDRKYMFVGAVTCQALIDLLQQLSQKDRDDLLLAILRRLLKGHQGFGGKLGGNRFTIVGPTSPNTLIGMTADQFEKLLADELLSVVAAR